MEWGKLFDGFIASPVFMVLIIAGLLALGLFIRVFLRPPRPRRRL